MSIRTSAHARRGRAALLGLGLLAAVPLLGGCSSFGPGPTRWAVVARGTVDHHPWVVLARSRRHDAPSAQFRSELGLGGHFGGGGGLWVRGRYSPDANQIPGTRRWVIFGAVPDDVAAIAMLDPVRRRAEPGTRVKTVAFPGFQGRYFALLLPASSHLLDGHTDDPGRTAVSPGQAILYDSGGRPLPPRDS
jgi:hypothetical protein